MYIYFYIYTHSVTDGFTVRKKGQKYLLDNTQSQNPCTTL